MEEQKSYKLNIFYVKWKQGTCRGKTRNNIGNHSRQLSSFTVSKKCATENEWASKWTQCHIQLWASRTLNAVRVKSQYLSSTPSLHVRPYFAIPFSSYFIWRFHSASFSDWTVLWFSLDNCVSNTIIWLITIWFKWGHTSFPCFWWGSLQLARFWQYTDTVIEMPRTVNIVALYKVTFTFVPFYPSTPMTTIIRNHLLTNHRGLSFPPKRIARDLPHLPSNSCLVSYLEGALPILAKPDRVESMYLCKTCWNCSAWVQVVWEAVASWGF